MRKLIKSSYSVFSKIIQYIVLLFGCEETIVGLLQFFKFIKSRHIFHAFTGTFYNPGPYACYIGVIIPLANFLIFAFNHKINKSLSGLLVYGMLFIAIVLIFASLSRCALIAMIIGVTVVSLKCLKGKISHCGKIFVSVLIIIIIVITVNLDISKRDSSDGRILIWKISTEIIQKSQFLEFDWDKVAGIYGEAQEKYFESGRGTEHEMMIADAPEYVFNEYLQVAIAFGPFASFAMIALMTGGFIASYNSKEYGIAGSIAAIAVVMMASYPLQFPLFTITIALILIAAYLSVSSNALKICGTAITITACTLFLLNSNKTDIKSEFSTAHILHRQGNYQKSNEILLDLTAKSSDPMILNIIGKNYQSLGMRDSAEYYFRKSTFRCPNRMYPHYLLMKLYADSVYFDKTKCYNEANTILTMRVKIPSPATDEMQREAKLMINNMKK